jgi:hypothetical protein
MAHFIPLKKKNKKAEDLRGSIYLRDMEIS